MRYTQKSVNRNHTCKPKVVEREIEEKVELERERERERERDRERERERRVGGYRLAKCFLYRIPSIRL
jgi:excinuclease UvrABC helicase subunit UvrB